MGTEVGQGEGDGAQDGEHRGGAPHERLVRDQAGAPDQEDVHQTRGSEQEERVVDPIPRGIVERCREPQGDQAGGEDRAERERRDGGAWADARELRAEDQNLFFGSKVGSIVPRARATSRRAG